MSIVRSLRVYLDTSIYQHSLESYSEEIRAPALGRVPSVVQVISLVHCLEIAKKNDPARAQELQALMQEVSKGYSTWVRHPWTICHDEWRAEARGERLDPESVFGATFAEVADKRESGAFEALSGLSVYELIETLRSLPEAMRIVEQKLELVQTTENHRQTRSRRWTKATRLSRALSRLPPGISGRLHVDLDRMSANRLMMAHEEGSMLSSRMYGPTDVEDNYHLGCAAYCDVAFVDADTFDRLERARYRPAHLMKVKDYPDWAEEQIDLWGASGNSK